LDELQRLEKAEKWQAEIDHERQLLKLVEAALPDPLPQEQPLAPDIVQAA
jgi:hypothetical protein